MQELLEQCGEIRRDFPQRRDACGWRRVSSAPGVEAPRRESNAQPTASDPAPISTMLRESSPRQLEELTFGSGCTDVDLVFLGPERDDVLTARTCRSRRQARREASSPSAPVLRPETHLRDPRPTGRHGHQALSVRLGPRERRHHHERVPAHPGGHGSGNSRGRRRLHPLLFALR